jgi:pimeloyl-ACP methyl ester carboxylesterase
MNPQPRIPYNRRLVADAWLAVKLHYREYNPDAAGRQVVVLLHGLFGSGANLHSIAQGLQDDYRVLVPDLPNHGRSPHTDEISYPVMAQAVSDWLQDLGIEEAWLAGHSMGGKIAMWLALTQGARVSGLMVMDMAPVTYPDRFGSIFAAMEALPLEHIADRADAEAFLAERLDNPDLRAYLLQNLVKDKDGAWRWRINLAGLSAQRATLMDFPQTTASYLGPAVFLYGSTSDYVRPEHASVIRKLFPYARERQIPGAGHWVYAERPDAVIEALRGFLT